MADAPFRKAGDLLAAFLDRDLSARAGNVSSFFRSWRKVAGERLSAHSSVVEIEKGIVIVEADHPSWIQLLQMREEEFLASIRLDWPELEIRGLAFRLAGTGRKKEEKPVSKEEALDRQVSPEDLESLRILGKTRERLEEDLRADAGKPPSDGDSRGTEGEAPQDKGGRQTAPDPKLSELLQRMRKSVNDRQKRQS